MSDDWDFKRERPMSDFGEMYDGYYFDRDGVRTVGFATVKPEYRGKGHFKELSGEKLKRGVKAVIIISPSLPSLDLLLTQGYVYLPDLHVCVWQRPAWTVAG